MRKAIQDLLEAAKSVIDEIDMRMGNLTDAELENLDVLRSGAHLLQAKADLADALAAMARAMEAADEAGPKEAP